MNLHLLHDAMIQEKIIANDLLLQIIKNEGNEIRKVIRDNNLSEDIFTFFAIYFARPFREFAAGYLLEGLDKLAGSTDIVLFVVTGRDWRILILKVVSGLSGAYAATQNGISRELNVLFV
jgi:hypothetical protein